MRTVIQLGLHTSAEWIYLSNKEGWVDDYPPKREYEEVPAFFQDDPEPFRYFGVDYAPESIAYVANKYPSLTYHADFICCGISDRIYSSLQHSKTWWVGQSWYFIDIFPHIIYPFIPLSVLFRMLNLNSVDILAMDIDGYEHIVLADIDNWEILPKLIVVEVHGGLAPSEKHRPEYKINEDIMLSTMVSKLEKNGYETIYDKDTVMKFLRD